MAIDNVLLEQLFFRNMKDETPLNLALNLNNTRMANLILYFISKVDHTGINVMKKVMKDLINHKSFKIYLMGLTSKNCQKKVQRQTIKLNQSYVICGFSVPFINKINSSEILKTHPSKSSYIEKCFFDKFMDENDSENVKIHTV